MPWDFMSHESCNIEIENNLTLDAKKRLLQNLVLGHWGVRIEYELGIESFHTSCMTDGQKKLNFGGDP